MSRKTYHAETTETPGYGKIVFDTYVEGQLCPVIEWLHGTGEDGTKKTLQQCVDFHYWFSKVADYLKCIVLIPQDRYGTFWNHNEVPKMQKVVDKYCNGQFLLGGLSGGGMGTLQAAENDSAAYTDVQQKVTFWLPLCPGNYEGLDEVRMASLQAPMWIFHGAKDTAVSISSIINTVDDIRRAGKTDLLYLSVFPNDDHYIWGEVMSAAMTIPPITPTTGAASWSGKNTINGVTVNVTVPCINNPAVSVYEYFLMQRKGAFKPLPLLTVTPPVPAPGTPTTTPVTIVSTTFTGTNRTQECAIKIWWSNNTNEVIAPCKWINPEPIIVDGKILQAYRIMKVGATRSVLYGPYKK